MFLNAGKTVVLPFYHRKNRFTDNDDTGITIDTKMIKYVTSHKILGLIYDTELSFRPHLERLNESIGSRLRALMALGGVGWGPSAKSKRMLYQGYIESKVRYGITSYAKYGDKSLISAIQQKMDICGRLITGLHKQTNLHIVRHAAEILSFDDLFLLEGVTLYDKVMRTPQSSLYRYIQSVKTFDGSIVSELQTCADSMINGSLFKREPMLNQKNFSDCTDNMEKVKFSTATIYSQEEVDRIRADADISIFSDGSVLNSRNYTDMTNSSGAGYIIVDEKARDLRAGTVSTGIIQVSYGAEAGGLKAVLHDLRVLLDQIPQGKKIVIFLDCLSLIQKISMLTPGNHIELQITRLLNELAELNTIVLQHVKAHNDIDGNEIVDELAKEAANRHNLDMDNQWITTTAMKSHVKKIIKQRNEHKLRIHALSSTSISNYISATNNLSKKVLVKDSFPAALTSWICQLSTGTCPRFFQYEFDWTDEKGVPICRCGMGRMTSQHILEKCALVDLPRMNFGREIENLMPRVDDYFTHPDAFRDFIENALPIYDNHKIA